LLILLGAIEARAIHRTRACDSLYTWCTEALHMSDGAAYKRIRAARVAERFAVVLPMLADGRLHLSAVVLLAPYLTIENASELLASATHLSKAAVERLVAERFPKPDVPTSVRSLHAGGSRPAPTATAQVVANIAAQLSPGTVDPTECAQNADLMGPLSAPDDSRAVQQVMLQALGDAAVKCGAESLSKPMLAALAGSVAEVIVNAAAAVTTEALEPCESRAKTTPAARHRERPLRAALRGPRSRCARLRPMHLRRPRRPAVHGALEPAARPRDPVRARRTDDGREPAAVLRRTQSVRGRTRVWI
jgi:hypothetical protein